MVRGALVVEVAAGELSAARHALARAIVLGALGFGRAVSLEGDAVVFGGGRIVLGPDGSASFELETRGAEWVRVAQAVLAATFVSVTTTLAFGWVPTWAVPAGGVAGGMWAAVSIARDRQRLRRRVRALLGNLRLLLDA